MHIEGLDGLDNKILEIIRDDARLSYSEIGEKAGVSRVCVKNRMAALEKKSIIKGYRTIIDEEAALDTGVSFFLDAEIWHQEFEAALAAFAAEKSIRKLYITSRDDHIHGIGFTTNRKNLSAMVTGCTVLRSSRRSVLMSSCPPLRMWMEASTMRYDIRNLNIWKDRPDRKSLVRNRYKTISNKGTLYPFFLGEALLETDISAMNLKVRSYNCLRRRGWNTVGDIILNISSIDDILQLRQCGRESAGEIIEQLVSLQESLILSSDRLLYQRIFNKLTQGEPEGRG